MKKLTKPGFFAFQILIRNHGQLFSQIHKAFVYVPGQQSWKKNVLIDFIVIYK